MKLKNSGASTEIPAQNHSEDHGDAIAEKNDSGDNTEKNTEPESKEVNDNEEESDTPDSHWNFDNKLNTKPIDNNNLEENTHDFNDEDNLQETAQEEVVKSDDNDTVKDNEDSDDINFACDITFGPQSLLAISSASQKTIEPDASNMNNDDEDDDESEFDIEHPKPLSMTDLFSKKGVSETHKIHNYNKAEEQHKQEQKRINQIKKENAVKIDNTDNLNNKTADASALKEAIDALCQKFEDKHFATNLHIMLDARIDCKFSFIDYVTTDGQFCYAALRWDDSIKKDANSVQVFDSLKKNKLFANMEFGDENINQEIFYFEHIQLVKEITDIFAMSDLKPVHIKCRDNPFSKTPGKPPEVKKLIEYVKYKLLALSAGETFYGFKAKGSAIEKNGKRISIEALNQCFDEFSAAKSRALRELSYSAQVTPPFLTRDKDELVLSFSKPKTRVFNKRRRSTPYKNESAL